MKRVAAVVAAVAALLVAGAAPSSAHPLGNFTVNVYTGVLVQPDRVVLDVVVDMAEIPAFQARRTVDRDGDDRVGDDEARAYAGAACADAAGRLAVTVDGRSVAVRLEAAGVTFPPGAAGLDTLRLTCALVAEADERGGERDIVVRNRNHDDRVGWREMAGVGDRTTLTQSDVGRRSISDRLARYPDDLLQSPPDQRVATLRARAGGPPAPPGFGPAGAPSAIAPRGVDRLTRSVTGLVGRQRLTAGVVMVGLLLSVVLGAAHAVAPGHGKTVMAAYLVGRRGSVRQAALIGVTVTLTHTAGVLVLGLVLSASTTLAPETVYPWLGLASGILLGAIGAGLLRSALRRRAQSRPAQSRPSPVPVAVGGGNGGHTHSHGGHAHSHGPGGDGSLGWRSLTALGFAGGLVPSPSAVVVLLGAIALGRPWLGVALVVGYGLGMAATLTGAGLLLVRFRDTVDRRTAGRELGRLAAVAQALPVLSAALILGVGALLSVRALTLL